MTMEAEGVGAALAADVGGGLFRAVGAIAMLLVDDDGFSDGGDGDVACVGATLGLEEIDDRATDGDVDGAAAAAINHRKILRAKLRAKAEVGVSADGRVGGSVG